MTATPSTVETEEEAVLPLPPKIVELFREPYGYWRFRGARGGRGSGKTRGFALMTAVVGYQLGMNGYTGQILCTRQFQNSLSDSSFIEIRESILATDARGELQYPWLADYWEVGETYIRSRDRTIEYNFMGLQRNLSSLKSTARILLCWVEEAEHVSERAWSVLIPTVREDESEIWLSWNPETRFSATDERFVQHPSDDMKIVEMNYVDNPFFPQRLEQDRLNDLALRPDTYPHIWLGEYMEYSAGAYYLNEMRAAKEQGRITSVPHDPGAAVFTAWDLGIDDSTAIWFVQFIGQEWHLIRYIEDDGMGLQHYVNLLDELAKPGKHDAPGYRYGGHVLPHDVEVRELGTGKSRLELLQSMGMHDIRVAPRLGVEDGIQAVRTVLPKCWFDERLCAGGIRALQRYEREYDDRRQVWKAKPNHNWASHGSDAFRYLALTSPKERQWNTSVKRNLKGVA